MRATQWTCWAMALLLSASLRGACAAISNLPRLRNRLPEGLRTVAWPRVVNHDPFRNLPYGRSLRFAEAGHRLPTLDAMTNVTVASCWLFVAPMDTTGTVAE